MGGLIFSKPPGSRDVSRPVSQLNSNKDNVSATPLESEKSIQNKYMDYMEHPAIPAIPQSAVYDIIIDTVYQSEVSTIAWPKSGTVKDKIWYIFKLPLTATQYISIPNPMGEGKENFYPLSLIMATCWIWLYSYIITWFTFEITIALDLHFSIVPLVIFPFGIALRDQKKFHDMNTMGKVFKDKIPQQRLSLAETFSGPVFQMTGLMGTAWLIYMYMKGKKVSFINEGIQY